MNHDNTILDTNTTSRKPIHITIHDSTTFFELLILFFDFRAFRHYKLVVVNLFK